MFHKAPELYDLFYGWKDYRAEAERVHALVEGRRPGSRTLLDVACGTGSHLTHLRQWFEIEGLDLDPGLLSIARDTLPGGAASAGGHAELRPRATVRHRGLPLQQHRLDGRRPPACCGEHRSAPVTGWPADR